MPNQLSSLLPYHKQLQTRDLTDIELLVIHCTELPDMASARAFAEKIHYPSGTGNSGHYYVSKAGDVYQWVANNRIAHHVLGHNEKSIGIELDNLGRYPNWYHSHQQIMHDIYPQAQIEALIKLIHSLEKQLPQLKYICAHEDLDTQLIPSEDNPQIQIRRKMDPGSLFPWEQVMQKIKLINIGILGACPRTD